MQSGQYGPRREEPSRLNCITRGFDNPYSGEREVSPPMARGPPTTTTAARPKLASGLRRQEWESAHVFAQSEGCVRSPSEKTIHIIRRDATCPTRDRGYRIVDFFLFGYFVYKEFKIRFFDIARALSGETVLQINFLGLLEVGRMSRFGNVLSSVGHMGRLRDVAPTTPDVRARWMRQLADCVTVSPLGIISCKNGRGA